MPLEVGFIPAGSLEPELGIVIPNGLPTNTTDVLLSAPKTISVLYAALTVEGRSEEANQVVAAHDAGVDAAVTVLNSTVSEALVYRGGRHYSPRQRLAEMLEREPGALPERREELAFQARAELRDPSVVKRVESTGLRINRLFHDSHNEGRGDPHLHTHLFIDPEVTAADDGRDYPRVPSVPRSAFEQAVWMYDAGINQSLAANLGTRSWLNDRTGRREIEGISDEVVVSFKGARCVPDPRFHQFVSADFVGYSL